jgi:hypothetical protein
MSDEKEPFDAANDAGDEGAAEAAPLTPEERIAELEAELAKGHDGLLRALAETARAASWLGSRRPSANCSRPLSDTG